MATTRKRYKNIDYKSDFCIMPKDRRWSIKREYGLVRHEVFGAYNKWKSTEDGLVIFLRPESHNMSNRGIHFDKKFDKYAKWIAMNAWCKYYNKTKEDFRARYGFCAIEP